MPKKALASLAVVLLLAAAGYWFYAPRASDAPAIVALMPAQTAGFFALPGLPQAWTDVRHSKFYQHVSTPTFWQRALGPQGYQRLMDEKAALEERLGFPLNEPTLNLVLGRELALAVVPSQSHVVDLIVYLRVSAAEKFAASLNRISSQGMQDVVRQTRTLDGIDIVTLHPKDAPTSLSYAFLGSLAVLSTDQVWVADAIKAHHGSATERLLLDPAMQAMPLKAAESNLAYGYYDVERLHAGGLANVPWMSQGLPSAATRLLQGTGKVTLQARRVDGGLLLETMAWSPPAPVASVFRQIESDGAVPPFRGVPAETFYLTHLDLLNLQGLWELLAQLATLQDQQAWQRLLAWFRAAAGVDLERDVLPLFTGVASLGLTAPFGTPHGSLMALPGVFLGLGLTDEAKGLQLMQRIGAHAGGPLLAAFLQRRVHEGQSIYYFSNPMLFPNPGYVISRQQLIVGSDVSLLQHMLDAAAGKSTPLTETKPYENVRKHFRITGGSITFIDVSTAVQQARGLWGPLNSWLRLLTRADWQPPALGGGGITLEPAALLELLQPLQLIGVASQAEPQGVRTEAFVSIRDR